MTQDTDVASNSIVAGRLSEKSGLVLSATACASVEIESGSDSNSPDAMEGSSPALNSADDAEDVHVKNNNCFTAIDTNGAGDGKEDDSVDDAITLPQSTHTLLFTEPIISRAFLQSVFIAGLSILCLLLALLNTEGAKLGGYKEVIPANVPPAVKIAQYASIFIALLMEEELPTGLYLLRRIPKQYFISKFPELQYSRFVCSCVLRIFMGYLFLLNVFLILIQANNVLEIFFDFIALQFLQQLDDIGFNLGRMGVFSKAFKNATMKRYFRVEFKVSKQGRNKRRISFFLKAIYFLNLGGLLAGMIFVTIRQSRGYFQCQSITVIYKEEIWEESLVRTPGEDAKEMVLIYPYFNGVYKQDGTSHDGRPVYVEMRKFDSTPYSDFSGEFNNITVPVKVPAKLQYCKDIRAWAFTHEYIRKSRRDDSDCPWLLRSEETEVYDIEEVQGPWQVWEGVIGTTDVHISCNECSDNSDCNLNGECKDGSCECYDDVDGVTFLGPHCAVRLKDECRTIYGEYYNDTWSVEEVDWTGSKGLIQQYDRPVYVYQGGNPDIDDSDALFLIYSGSRWFGVYQTQGKMLEQDESFRKFFEGAITNYHAFWDRALQQGTVVVSDPTTNGIPVGVDFYFIGETGDQFGPFGALYPLQVNNETGRGVFRCTESTPFIDLVTSNGTGPPRQRMLRRDGLFDNYLWLGE